MNRIDKKPGIYFIPVGVDNCSAAAKQMYKYVCDSFRSSSFNVQRILKEENIKNTRLLL
ncbi:MAG: hypothetical protein GXZ13_04655 [Synergistaceae bacterium]|nr:hypothetical protein [Synergistaceae bacterium]